MQRCGAPLSPASRIWTRSSFGGFSRRSSVHGGRIRWGGHRIYPWWPDPHMSAVAGSMGMVAGSVGVVAGSVGGPPSGGGG